jgi:glycosyltransferase involved in cell wall biosynthesis
MRIAVYKDTFAARRGADVAVQLLIDGLRARGHDVVAVTDEDGDLRGRISGCDVCIAAGTNEMLALTDGGRNRPPVKTILQFHTHPLYPFRHWIRRWRRCRAIRRAIAQVDAVQVLLPSHEGVLRRKVGYSGQVYVIGNTSRFETRAPCPDDGRTIIYPAALNDDKRQVLLIDAFARVAGDFPGWRVVLYGTGKASFEAKLRTRVAAAGLLERVEFAGYCPDLANAYASCSFVAFPSANEGFPLTVVDAAAFGKSVLALADTPSVAEMLTDGETGMLCGSTVAAYADGLARLMHDADLRRRLGEAACRQFASAYSHAAFLDRWEAALRDVYCG